MMKLHISLTHLSKKMGTPRLERGSLIAARSDTDLGDVATIRSSIARHTAYQQPFSAIIPDVASEI
jgi:hypothetical protein